MVCVYIYIYISVCVVIKTMYPPGYPHNGFLAPMKLGT